MMMTKEIILNRIEEALKGRISDYKNSRHKDLQLKKAIALASAKGKPELLKQFKKELELVSGEFLSVNSLDEVAKILSRLLKESNFREFVICQEKVCKDIAEIVVNQHLGISYLSVTDLGNTERKSRLAQVPLALVEAIYAIADTGSLVFSYGGYSLLPHFLSDCVVVLFDWSKIIPNQFELFGSMTSERTKNLSIVTGPSRTADIEKVLVLGAHGPRRLVAIHINKPPMEKER
jgi:L-lactate dehydrogenase complex protein LldG